VKDRFMPLPEVQKIAGDKSRTTIWRWCRDGNFPKPHQIGPNSIAWLETEVMEWIEQKTSASAAS